MMEKVFSSKIPVSSMLELHGSTVVISPVKDFLDCSYFLCLVPVRLKISREADIYEIVGNNFQKVNYCIAST